MKQRSAIHVFELPWNTKSDDVFAGLANRFKTTAPTIQRDSFEYLDTFDWRLHQRGLSLVRTAREYQLRKVDDDSVIETAPLCDDARLWREFPEGGLKQRIRDIIKERAVSKVGEVALRSRRVRVLNSDDKTVARVVIQVGEAYCQGRSTARIRSLGILPIKGYTKEAGEIASHLAATGLRPARLSVFEVAVVACGREPGDYSSKLDLNLDPSMTGRQAAGVIFAHLLDTMERNVDGIREDIDTEFLHDFRVAVRRTRSGLSQLKIALPSDSASIFNKRFAELGRGTNRLRDLDVYLLNRERYMSMLDGNLREGLAPLFQKLAEERSIHQKSLVDLLDSRRYRELVGEWRQTLRTFVNPVTFDDFAAISVSNLARKVIRKRHNRVIKTGRAINGDSPDGALHSLRINCKKLRYMLEFFASLYPRKIIGEFIKQLKQLQDNLGDFNDLSVQQTELESFLRQNKSGVQADTAAAVGALIAKLEFRQHEVRSQFAAAFDAFAGPHNQERFEKLFASKKHR